jgi:hypothetical protein
MVTSLKNYYMIKNPRDDFRRPDMMHSNWQKLHSRKVREDFALAYNVVLSACHCGTR